MSVKHSFGEFAADLLRVGAAMEIAADAAIVRSCKLVKRKARGMIGHPQPIWPPLKPETIARKAHGDTPLYETGALKDSIEWSAPHHEAGKTVGYVGSNHDEAVWHELGTVRIPPRPFLSMAAAGQEGEIHKLIGDMMFAAAMGQLHGAWHLLAHVYHEAKEFGEEVLEEGGEGERRRR